MMRRLALIALLALPLVQPLAAGPRPPGRASILLFWEQGFPSVDTAAPSSELGSALPTHDTANSDALATALASSNVGLLVLPYGSAFPESAWPAILAFLERGGNLLVLGGKPFTRPAYREGAHWLLRSPRTTFAEKLFINDYQQTPASVGLEFRGNPDAAPLDLPPFPWNRAFSLTLRLTDEDLYAREGSAGTIDARLVPLVWGLSAGRRLSAPAVRLDHLRNHFAGGRWIFLACDLPAGFFSTDAARKLIPALARDALNGAEDFIVRPGSPLFLPTEPPTFSAHWSRFDNAAPPPARLSLELSTAGAVLAKKEVRLAASSFPAAAQFEFPPDDRSGLHVLTARLYLGDQLHAVYRTGYWLRDPAALASGPRVAVSGDYFTLNGQTELIAGTTYMASDVQRQFFFDPNPYIWDRDMAELRAAGFNMLRTGWWTAWDRVLPEGSSPNENALRSVEAFLLTSRAHDLPVQFTVFAFAPEVLGGANPYLDPDALRRQRDLVLALVERFRDAPFLIWDLINEPSFANPRRLWSTRPNGDALESKAWAEWLAARHKSRDELADAWRIPPLPPDAAPPLPDEDEFSFRAPQRTMQGSNALKAFDFYLFAQETFARWAGILRDVIRAAGSNQLITVGQDEGGGRDRPSPAFFSPAVDFTTTHPWWQNDALLWDSLVAAQPGKPMLVQEVGVARDMQIDASERYTPAEKAALLERKLAFAAATGAGAIQWLWNTNAYMRNDNEAAIGALRADATEKPEAAVLRTFAAFAAASRGLLSDPAPPPVTIVTAQALQYSALSWLGLDAQMRSLRALEYGCRVPAAIVAENQLAQLGHPRLAILPSPQVFTDDGWSHLLDYVRAGGTLLITGSVERDPYWRVTKRLRSLGLDAAPASLTFRQDELSLGTQHIPLSFAFDRQQFAEVLSTPRDPSSGGLHELSVGVGKIYITDDPIELAESLEPTVALYRWTLAKAGIASAFTGALPSPGVLIRRAVFPNALLYLFISESARDEQISIRDSETGAAFNFLLASRRARLLLLDPHSHATLASFGNN